MGKVSVIDHPLVQHKLSVLRDRRTGTKEFRELIYEMSIMLGYEATRGLALEDAWWKRRLLPQTLRCFRIKSSA